MTDFQTRDHEELHEALVDAYPSRAELDRMVRGALDGLNLERVASAQLGLDDVVDQLITWARNKRKLDQLIEGAYERRKGNPKLKAFRDRWQDKRDFDGVVVPPSPKNASSPPRYLLCDREVAWNRLEIAAKASGGHIVVVCGKRGDGHARFAERIKAFAAESCSAIVRPLRARIFDLPLEKCTAQHVLCEALETSIDAVDDTLAAWLEERSVILLYPTVETTEQAAWLRQHDTEHLPALMNAVQARANGAMPRYGLVAVQPIRWKPGLLDFVPWFSEHNRTHRELGIHLEHKSTSVGSPPIVVWQEHLDAISQTDLATFFTTIYAHDIDARARALARAEQHVGRSAEEIFDWLVEELQ